MDSPAITSRQSQVTRSCGSDDDDVEAVTVDSPAIMADPRLATSLCCLALSFSLTDPELISLQG